MFFLSKRKKYSREFADYVSKMVVLDGRKIIDICEELDISYGTLRHWVGDYRKKQKQAEGEKQKRLLSATEYQELYEKERRARLEMEEENEILKKAMHIFTQEKE